MFHTSVNQGVRSDGDDGLALEFSEPEPEGRRLVARRGNEARGLTCGVDLGWVGVAHFNSFPESFAKIAGSKALQRLKPA
jgi:hypothetical protein